MNYHWRFSTLTGIYGVYQILNLVNGKRYIGRSSQGTRIRARWECHTRSLTRGTHKNVKLQRAWDKYGPEAFEFSVLVRTSPKDEYAAVLEGRLVASFDSYRNGYNQTANGDRWSKDTRHREASKLSISAALKGKKKSPEAVAKQAAQIRGRKQSDEHAAKSRVAAIGYKHTAEARQSISEKQKGKILSEDHKNKISKARLGISLSEEHVLKVAAANRGKKRTEEQRKRMSESMKGKKRSPEGCQRIAEARKLYWAKKRGDYEY